MTFPFADKVFTVYSDPAYAYQCKEWSDKKARIGHALQTGDVGTTRYLSHSIVVLGFGEITSEPGVEPKTTECVAVVELTRRRRNRSAGLCTYILPDEHAVGGSNPEVAAA